jgi:DNA-binding MarR family transcriptional regulator
VPDAPEHDLTMARENAGAARAAVTPNDLDPIIHERVRLSIVAALAARRKMDYLELRTLLGVTDGNLAAHANALEKAGYVAVEKSFAGRKPRTSYRLTPSGRRAFERHVESLRRLLGETTIP